MDPEFGREIERLLDALPKKERTEHARAFAAKLLDHLATLADAEIADLVRDQVPAAPARRLTALYRGSPPARPRTPLATSSLLTRSHGEPPLGQELAREIETADHVDAIIGVMPYYTGSSKGPNSAARVDYPGRGMIEQTGLPPGFQSAFFLLSDAGIAGHYDNAVGIGDAGSSGIGRRIGADLMRIHPGRNLRGGQWRESILQRNERRHVHIFQAIPQAFRVAA